MTGPTVLAVQHEEDDPPALVGDWLEHVGVEVSVVRAYLGEPVPASLDEVAADGLLVMGGAMGAGDDDVAPWLPATRELIRATTEQQRPVLGICLGHQLVARALGGEVGVNPGGQTIGVQEVTRCDGAEEDPLASALPRSCLVAQWNDDTVLEPPAGATVLARNGRGDLLLARFDDMVWGVQGHPEVTPDLVGAWAHDAHAQGALTAARPDEIPELLDELGRRLPEIETAWRPLVEAWAALLSPLSERDR